MSCWRKHCPESQASGHTKEKPEHGSEPGSHPRPLRSLGKTCGNLLNVGHTHRSGRSNVSEKMEERITKERRNQTCSALGSSCSRAQIPTTRCEQCHQGPLLRIVRHTTKGSGQQRKCCWTDSQQQTKQQRQTFINWPRFRCGWEVWGYVQLGRFYVLRPNPCCILPHFVHPFFELYALNPILLFTLFLSNFNFSAV